MLPALRLFILLAIAFTFGILALLVKNALVSCPEARSYTAAPSSGPDDGYLSSASQSPSVYRSPPATSSVCSARLERGETSPGAGAKRLWADRGCLPVSGGDGDGAMVVTGFATPEIHENRRGHGVARGAHQRSSLRLMAGTFVSGLREPDGGGDARRARHFCEHPTLVFL